MHGNDFHEVVTNLDASSVGSPTIDPAVSPFGGGSLRLTAGNYITLPYSSHWDFGPDPFTIEFCVKFNGDMNGKTLMGAYLAGGAYWNIYVGWNNWLEFQWFDGSTSHTTNLGGAGIASSWIAFCIQRDALGAVMIWANFVGSSSVNSPNTTSSWGYNIVTGGSNLSIGSPDVDVWVSELRITKGVSRYTNLEGSYLIPTAPFPNTDHEIYEDVVSETPFISAYLGTGNILFDELDELMGSAASIVVSYPRVASDNIIITDPPLIATRGRVVTASDTVVATTSMSVTLGSILADFATLADSIGVAARYHLALSELAGLQDALLAGKPISVSDAVGVTHALSVLQGITVAEKIGISELLNYPVKFGLSLRDTISTYDALNNFLHFELSETITVQETMSALSRHFTALSEAITASDTITPHAVLCVEAHDEGIFSDDFSLKMIYRPEIREQINFRMVLATPDGGITAWTVNTRTGAVTEYENFNFNSFAQSGAHYIAASDDGLYVLDGTDDNGVPTSAHLKSGYAQFGGSRFVSFKAAYLGIRGAGGIYLKLDTGDGKTYTYKAVIQNQQSTKVLFGKGLRARYFTFELISDGGDWDLDSVEFIPLVAQRRV
jgi:hypothetical protein